MGIVLVLVLDLGVRYEQLNTISQGLQGQPFIILQPKWHTCNMDTVTFTRNDAFTRRS